MNTINMVLLLIALILYEYFLEKNDIFIVKIRKRNIYFNDIDRSSNYFQYPYSI